MQDIFIRNEFIAVPVSDEPLDFVLDKSKVDVNAATIVANLARYGYTIDRATFNALMNAKTTELAEWWKATEKALKEITGANRRMEKHVVYKNFPREVLDMDMATSLVNQLLIYWGVPYDYLREQEVERPPLKEISKLKVLTLADDMTETNLFANLKATPNRWSDNQKNWAFRLFANRNAVVMSEFAFKENGIQLAGVHFDKIEFDASSATDVLRLCAILSTADVSLREKVHLRRFKRAERTRLLAALETQANLFADMAARPDLWKRLMERLRPGDYKNRFPRVVAAYDQLYKKELKSFAALIDPPVPTVETLKVAATRPGEFLRRFHYFYGWFQAVAVDYFVPVLPKLTSRQLVGLRGYLRTINQRKTLMYPPKSNWARVQILPNRKIKFKILHLRRIDAAISEILAKRLKAAYPQGMAVDLTVDQIKFQTNDQKLAEYGRGTEFDIPRNITFVRSASYWQKDSKGFGNIWYDNGWNFFDSDWRALGTCGWNEQQYFSPNIPSSLWRRRHEDHNLEAAAIFSGDPTNTKDLKGRACQMADLYLDRLAAVGVRYAVWNVLCYSKLKFSEAEDVLATIQMGEKPEAGKLYEPSRAQMVFPLKSASYTSYVAYIDIKRRKLVYMDAGFPGSTTSAASNSKKLESLMPAYVEYLESLPTVLELVQDADEGTMPVLYSDENINITDGQAFVFRPTKRDNKYRRVSVIDLVDIR